MIDHETPMLTGRVVEIVAGSSVEPGIDVRLQVTNVTTRPLSLLGGRARVVLGHTSIERVIPVEIWPGADLRLSVAPGKTSDVRVRPCLNGLALQSIEDARNGNDLTFLLELRLIVHDQKSESSVPTEALVRADGQGGAIRGVIPQSDWVRILGQLEWESIQLVEIPMPRLRGRCPGAVASYHEALGHHRAGNWRKALASCREVFEALAWIGTPEGAKRPDWETLGQLLGGGKSGDELDAIVQALAPFLHLGRHHQPSDVTAVEKRDSYLALYFTAGILRYLS